jgi:hypothetical protein
MRHVREVDLLTLLVDCAEKVTLGKSLPDVCDPLLSLDGFARAAETSGKRMGSKPVLRMGSKKRRTRG